MNDCVAPLENTCDGALLARISVQNQEFVVGRNSIEVAWIHVLSRRTRSRPGSTVSGDSGNKIIRSHLLGALEDILDQCHFLERKVPKNGCPHNPETRHGWLAY